MIAAKGSVIGGLRRMCGVAVLIVGAMLAGLSPALAQEINPLEVEVDPNGVDLLTVKATPQMPTLAIPAAPELTFKNLSDFWPILQGEMAPGSPTGDVVYSVNAGGMASDGFRCLEGPGSCVGAKGTGSVLFGGGNVGPFYYTQGGTGKKITFTIQYGNQSLPTVGQVFFYVGTEVITPGGPTLTFTYDSGYAFPGYNIISYRPATVTSSSGYELQFTYQSNDATNGSWKILQKAVIARTAEPGVPLASLTYAGTNPNFTVTDIANRVYQCSNCQNALNAPSPGTFDSMTLPGDAAPSYDVSNSNNSNGRVLTVVNDGVTYTYDAVNDPAFGPAAFGSVTINAPNGYYRQIEISSIAQGTAGNFYTPGSNQGAYAPPRSRIASVTNSENGTTYYGYNAGGRVTSIIYPEGNTVGVTYDVSGNITSMVTTPKPGSGQSALTVSAAYNSGFECDAADCFRPVWTRDAMGRQTDYTWGQYSGLLLTQLDPPDENNIRRKVKNTYDGSGRLTRTEICEADANGNELTCGTAASFATEYTYFAGTRLPETESVTDGLGNNPLTTTYTYDPAGRQVSLNGPLAGSEDATYAHYDILGRRIWETGPQGEDGYRPATNTEYRVADDQVDRVRTGYVAGSTTAASTPVFIGVISDVETDYNSRRLATETTVKSGTGTLFSVTQMNYDGLNRSDCTAVRMNLANLPAGACTAGTPGSDGEDRITRQHYDTESRVIRIEQGVDTSLVRDYATYTFTPNGQMASMTDARGYKASMMYDGFDRQTHWYFPSPTTTGAINPNDYEQYGYDANGNRISLRKRDGSTITYQYDNLNRVIRKTIPDTRPELHADHTRDVFYEYDIRGLQLHARFGSDSGVGTTSVYDLYGRMTSVTDNASGTSRTLQSQYLPDGSRWELKYPDNQAFRSYYWPGGPFNAMTGPLGEIMVDYDYDNEGRLDQIRRDATAPKQQWGYDAIGRMDSNFIDAPTSAFDVTWDYTRNPASQIRSESQTNDSFSWDGYVPVDRSYVTNGLNQYTSVSGQAYCYDKNGNLTADGDFVYLYDVENRLVEMRAPANTDCENLAYTGQIMAELRYDPMGRLYRIENFINGVGQGPVTMLYDGDALVAEYNASGTMLARYVHGPMQGADDPIAEYSGSSIAAANRTNLYTDSRGSIVLRAGATGGAPSINAYDEYGQPSTSNIGRFQYTGQVWLPELGMYYYKARIYSPALGRFMQTDPIGYEDNVNLYGYVGQDPVNNLDPEGTRLLTVIRNAIVGIPDAINEGLNAVDRVTSGPFSDNPEDHPTAEDFVRAGQALVTTGIGVAGVASRAGAASRAGTPRGGRTSANRCCFVAGTLVDTETGLRPIENIEVGELVWARDEVTGETALKAVTGLIQRHERVIWEVSLTGANGEAESFETTDDHPWWIAGQGWKRTEELVAGMAVVTRDGRGMVLASVLETYRTDVTYNLTVADFETYFVGQQRVLVHNCPGFSRRTQSEIRERNRQAGQGTEHCENCGQVVQRQQGPNQRGQQIAPDRSEVDHRQRKADGGSNDADNGQVLCHECHVRKTAQENRRNPQ